MTTALPTGRCRTWLSSASAAVVGRVEPGETVLSCENDEPPVPGLD
jgi:hypothetical protein